MSKKHTLFDKRGFTMVEVLVAVVILSIGLLAVAGMQTTSLKGGSSALHRSQAVMSASDIMDRMRANRQVALADGYDIALTENIVAPATTLNEEDLLEWKTFLTNALPSGDGSVDVVGQVATVTVQWTDSYGLEQIQMVTQL